MEEERSSAGFGLERERGDAGFGLEQERRGGGFEMEEERSGAGFRLEQERSGAGLGSIFFVLRILGQSLTTYCIRQTKCECMSPKIVSFGSYLNVLSNYIIFATYNIYFICENHGQICPRIQGRLVNVGLLS